MIGAPVGKRKASIRCQDKRASGVSVLVFFPKGQEADVLKIGKETVFSFTVKGYIRNQLIGVFNKTLRGEVEAGSANDMKAILVDPKAAKGKTVECEVSFPPKPGEAGSLYRKELVMHKTPLDKVRASIMCKQESGGSVPVGLYFPKGKKDQLLTIAALTRIKVKVVGVNSNRIVCLFDGIASGAVDMPPKTDMRSIALHADEFKDKVVTCEVNLKPYISKSNYVGSAKGALIRGEKVGKKYVSVTCKDAVNRYGGTRVEVFFPKGSKDKKEKIRKGDKLKLKIKGKVYDTLVAVSGD
jgi:hypothetical protein